jgi:hypothetical protein
MYQNERRHISEDRNLHVPWFHHIADRLSLQQSHNILAFITKLTALSGFRARVSVVVKALCYKPEDRGFDTR